MKSVAAIVQCFRENYTFLAKTIKLILANLRIWQNKTVRDSPPHRKSSSINLLLLLLNNHSIIIYTQQIENLLKGNT